MKQVIAFLGAIIFVTILGAVWVAIPIIGAIIGTIIPIALGIYLIYHALLDNKN